MDSCLDLLCSRKYHSTGPRLYLPRNTHGISNTYRALAKGPLPCVLSYGMYIAICRLAIQRSIDHCGMASTLSAPIVIHASIVTGTDSEST